MPMPNHMEHKFTPQQKADVINGLKTAIDTLNSLQVVQLTALERRKANGVSNKRLPYVQQTFNTLAPNYPQVQPPYLSLADETTNFEMMEMLREIMPLLNEAHERYTDYYIASQHNAFTYMKHFYASAKRTPIGKVVCQALAPLFARPKHSRS